MVNKKIRCVEDVFKHISKINITYITSIPTQFVHIYRPELLK